MGTFEELVQAFSKQDHKVQMDEQVYMSLWTLKQEQIEWVDKYYEILWENIKVVELLSTQGGW
jgi:hypothetical protein